MLRRGPLSVTSTLRVRLEIATALDAAHAVGGEVRGRRTRLLLEDAELPTSTSVVERVLETTAQPVHLGNGDSVIHTSLGVALSGAGT